MITLYIVNNNGEKNDDAFIVDAVATLRSRTMQFCEKMDLLLGTGLIL